MTIFLWTRALLPGSLAVLLLSCQGQPTTDAPPAAARAPLSPAAASPGAVKSLPDAPPEPAVDTVAPGSIFVNDLPLVMRRQVLQQRVGPPDSSYTATVPTTAPGYCFGDEQLPEPTDFEQYRGACYQRTGDTLTFLLTSGPAAPLQVRIGPHRITERTTLAELRRMFPASSRRALTREADGSQVLTLYPPAATATDEWYALVLNHGRVTQFYNVCRCIYD